MVFNGKFLSTQLSGVHRVARELVSGVDGLLAEREPQSNLDWELALPRDTGRRLPLARVVQRQVGWMTKQAWEQLELARFARGKVLVGLCNMAPLSAQNTVTLIHDAHVYLTPESSSKAFNAWYGFALPRIGTAAGRVITVSNYSRDQLARHGVAPPEKISVVHNGADHLLKVAPNAEVLQGLGLRPRRYVLAVANSQAHKNVGLIFEAARHPAMAGLRVVVVGPDTAEAFARVGQLPPPDVVFAGYREDGELRALYEHAACLLFPSKTEGFGLPPMEAMSLGCPVMAASSGALPEILGSAAVFLDHQDPAAWAKGAALLACDEAYRDRLVTAGRARAQQFRWRDSAERLLTIIEEVQRSQAATCS